MAEIRWTSKALELPVVADILHDETDVEVWEEHHPGLLEELREAVCE